VASTTSSGVARRPGSVVGSGQLCHLVLTFSGMSNQGQGAQTWVCASRPVCRPNAARRPRSLAASEGAMTRIVGASCSGGAPMMKKRRTPAVYSRSTACFTACAAHSACSQAHELPRSSALHAVAACQAHEVLRARCVRPRTWMPLLRTAGR